MHRRAKLVSYDVRRGEKVGMAYPCAAEKDAFF